MTNLHGHRKVCCQFIRIRHIHRLLRIGLIASGRSAYLDHVQLQSSWSERAQQGHRYSLILSVFFHPYLSSLVILEGEDEEIGRMRISLQLELDEASCMTLNRLRDATLRAVQLHTADHLVVLRIKLLLLIDYDPLTRHNHPNGHLSVINENMSKQRRKKDERK